MTTAPVPSITDEQIAEIEYLANNATGGDWEFHISEIRANYDSDGYTVIAEAPSVPKNWRDQRDTNMRYMATVCPVAAQALIYRLRAAERDAARYQFMACACEVTYMGTVIEDEAQFDRVMSGGKP